MKVEHLEELVLSLMKDSDQASKPGYSEPSSGNESSPQPSLNEASESLGRFSIDNNQPNYVGGSHWTAILDSVC
jgi:hypothetical protein